MHPSTSRTSATLTSAWIDPHRAFSGVAPIDHLFNRLDGLYPHRWRSAFANQQAIANWRQAWSEGLADEGITMAEVKRGIAECRRMFDWPPSFAEFVKACRPALNYEQAFLEAVAQMQRRQTGDDQWPSPSIYWAAVSLGGDLNRYAYSDIKGRWAKAMDDAIEAVKTGEKPDSVPPRLDALPAPGTTMSQEVAERNMDAIKAMLGVVAMAKMLTAEAA